MYSTVALTVYACLGHVPLRGLKHDIAHVTYHTYVSYMLVPFLNFECGAGVSCVHVLACRIVNVLFGKFTSGIYS